MCGRIILLAALCSTIAVMSVCIGFIGCVGGDTASAVRGLLLAEHGKSEYVIYFDVNAASSVKKAAEEIQRVIFRSTGANLPIVKEPKSPMICLGDNKFARSVGISLEGIPEEGFQIDAKGKNLYIAGVDTPDNELTAGGGCSQGTLYGALEFLEHFIGARWLMPGDIGEDIPSCPVLTVKNLPLRGAPDFAYRFLYEAGSITDVKMQNWCGRVRIAEKEPARNHPDIRFSCALWVFHNHIWDRYPSPSVLLNYPEYLALVGGQRYNPQNRHERKLCTTNQELIEIAAAYTASWFEKYPYLRSYSISPNDGGGWCECPNCSALDESVDTAKWPGAKLYPKSLTHRILTYYNEVAKLVAKKYPDRPLGAYLYAEYLYPPQKPIQMEPNLFFFLATRPYYGFTLYKEELAEEFPRLIAAWAECIPPGRLAYYDLPTMMTTRKFIGAPQPVGISILKLVFPTVKKYGLKGVFFYGQGWGTGGAHNYLAAKLMWNANANIDAMFDEWLARAYGVSAAAPMKKLNLLLEERLALYKRVISIDRQCRFDEKLALAVYKPLFSQIETLYKEALEKADTPVRQQRLQMFGDNLIVLHWNLRKAGALENPEKSVFYLSDADYQQFVAKKHSILSLPFDEKRLLEPQLTSVLPKQNRTLNVNRVTAGSPLIDGDITDIAWTGASKATGFSLIGSTTCATQATTAQVMFDDTNLYLAFNCAEKKADTIRKTCSIRDSGLIFSDDFVELFLAPPADKADEAEGIVRRNFWQIAVNANGVIWDAFGEDVNKNVAAQAAARVTDSGWTAELSIPLKDLKIVDIAKGLFRANICREEKPHNELSSWNAVYKSFNDPEYFGTWRFADLK